MGFQMIYTPEMQALNEVLPKLAVGDFWETQNITKEQAAKVAQDLAWSMIGRSFVTKTEKGQRIVVRVR
jgi:hypothetical protein